MERNWSLERKWLKRRSGEKKRDEEHETNVRRRSLWYLDTMSVNTFLKINFNLVLKQKEIYIYT